MRTASSAPGGRIGLWIAIAALCVNAPRLVQAFLEADGLQLNPQLRPVLMGATGVAAALTLTGGGAWLAHETPCVNLRHDFPRPSSGSGTIRRRVGQERRAWLGRMEVHLSRLSRGSSAKP